MNSLEKLSNTWNLPRLHPENLSSLVAVTVNVAGWKLVPALKFVGIPAIVRTSPTVNPYPVFVMTGSDILSAILTFIDTEAPIPVLPLISLISS